MTDVDAGHYSGMRVHLHVDKNKLETLENHVKLFKIKMPKNKEVTIPLL